MREGWISKTLDELCEIARGGSPRPIKAFITEDPDGVNWIKISDATASSKYIYKTKQKIKPEGIKRSRFVNEGDFLLSNSMSFGRPYIMRTTGCIHDGWLVLSDKSGLFDQDYLYYFLGSPAAYKQFDSRAAGSTVRNLNIDLVRTVTIPLPPLAEQKRIVGVLDQAFAGIEQALAAARKNRANARALFETTLNTTFTQKGEGWVETTLLDVAEENCSLSYGIVQPGNNFPNGLHVVRPTDLKTNTIELDGLKRIDPTRAESYKRTMLKGRELLLCVRGSTGTVSIASSALAGANVTRGIVPIRFDPQKIDQLFGYFQLLAKPFQDQIRAGTYGAALMQINIRDLKKVVVSAPPLADQKIIVKKLNTLSAQTQALEALYQRKIDALEDLKQSFLQQAFAGKLTTTQEDAA